jgi:hypothetical protein
VPGMLDTLMLPEAGSTDQRSSGNGRNGVSMLGM